MKKLIIALLFGLVLSTPATAATAFWTGKMVQVQTVTGQFGWNCQYMYAGNYFWRVFAGVCPNSIQVY